MKQTIRDLNEAKAAYSKAQDALQRACLDLFPRPNSVRESKSWQDLYYSQPNANVAATSYISRLSKFEAEHPTLVSLLVPYVQACVSAAVKVNNARYEWKATKGQHIVSHDDGRYQYPTNAEPVERQEGRVVGVVDGQVLLLRFGNGTQPALIVSRTVKRLEIRRLWNRGTKYAAWDSKTSKISRTDARILGFAHLCPQDPKVSQL
jgi:hypothetical protein